jgi:hypothetical protein
MVEPRKFEVGETLNDIQYIILIKSAAIDLAKKDAFLMVIFCMAALQKFSLV